jgi:hypothetical protein
MSETLACPWCGEESGVGPSGYAAYSHDDLRCQACGHQLEAELDAITMTDGVWDEQTFIRKREENPHDQATQVP